MNENDLAARWRTPDGAEIALEVFRRLMTGETLAGLELTQHNGRVDLRGTAAPPPQRLKALQTKGWTVQELEGYLRFEGVRLANLDLSGGQLESFRFFNTRIANCCFDGARCQDWRLWAVDVADSTFIGSDLRKAVLGSWYEGRGNVYQLVNFSGANLRSIVCPAATFIDCDFGDAQLAKVDFQSTSFIRCRFAGLLREVIFYDHGFKTGKPDPNPMENVDFSQAELRMVEFRHLDLDRVKFPSDNKHLVVNEYRCVLERAVQELKDDARWRGLHAVLAHRLKWARSNQRIGAFNLRDIADAGGEAEAQFAAVLLSRLEKECARS